MRNWVATVVAMVLGMVLASCGGDGRSTEDSGGFDGGLMDAPIVPDSDSPDIGTDAGVLAGEGEPCTVDAACQLGLECLASLCTSVGGVSEPCTRDSTCDPDLLCEGGVCVESVQVRLCHCIYTVATMTPVEVEMQVGETLVGPILADVCSPCVSVPLGSGVPLEIRRTENGAVLRTGTLEISGEVPIIGIAFTAGTFEAVRTTCEPLTGFCG